MIEKVAERRALPAEVIEQIRIKTDGVPLFVEELTKMCGGVWSVRGRGIRAGRPPLPAGNSRHVAGSADGAARSARRRPKRLRNWARRWDESSRMSCSRPSRH